MTRRGGLVIWMLLACLPGSAVPEAAWGQVDPFSPMARIAQQPAGHGPGSHPTGSPTVSPPLADVYPALGDVPSQRPVYGGLVGYEPEPCDASYRWQVAPNGLLYHSYLAGGREPRFASKFVRMENYGWIWDVTLGGRVGVVRYGSDDEVYPEGFQIDIEGAVFPRLDLGVGQDRELISEDFRAGMPFTVRRGPWEGKLAYYHISSHLGDEYVLAYPQALRINYVRDSIVVGGAVRPIPSLRLYAETAWAFNTDGGAQPWEFQFGVDYSPLVTSGALGSPFFAVNAHLREEIDFGGGLTAETGLQWRGRTGHLFRVGLYYFNGMSDHRQFFTNHEEIMGFGMWYDY